MRVYSVKLIGIEKVRNYGKTVLIKNMFESGWWGGASPLDSLMPARAVNNVSYTYTNQSIWLQYDAG